MGPFSSAPVPPLLLRWCRAEVLLLCAHGGGTRVKNRADHRVKISSKGLNVHEHAPVCGLGEPGECCEQHHHGWVDRQAAAFTWCTRLLKRCKAFWAQSATQRPSSRWDCTASALVIFGSLQTSATKSQMTMPNPCSHSTSNLPYHNSCRCRTSALRLKYLLRQLRKTHSTFSTEQRMTVA